MNREIKFRAWDGFKFNDMPTIWNGKVWNDVADCEMVGVILMQFTGLRDKNGKEIYDGDIIHCHQADVNTVHWYWDSWCYENYHASSLPLGDLGNPYSNGGLLNCEIIGNIYQNPELIKSK